MKYGTFEMMPAMFNNTEAWVCFANEWREMPHAEVLQKTKIMSEAEFKRTFADLPDLPKAAFSD